MSESITATPVGSASELISSSNSFTRDLGFVGYEALEPILLAALASESPLLLLGNHGTGKSLLLERLAEALDLQWRHYNASLLNFDDLVGYPLPDENNKLHFIETPASIWGAQAVLFDEVSRARPDIQNRLFPIIHERKVQGIPLEHLKHRWAAINPPPTSDEYVNQYSGIEPLDLALADRFAFHIKVPDWHNFEGEQKLELLKVSISRVAGSSDLVELVERTKALLKKVQDRITEQTIIYVNQIVIHCAQAGLQLSARRGVLLSRNLWATQAAIEVLNRSENCLEDTKNFNPHWDQAGAFLALKCSLPNAASGIDFSEGKLLAIHKEAWICANQSLVTDLHRILLIRNPVQRVLEAINCPAIDSDDLVTICIDSLNQAPVGSCYALAQYVFESGLVERLPLLPAEEFSGYFKPLVAGARVSQRARIRSKKHDCWTRILDIQTKLNPAIVQCEWIANLLADAFSRNKLEEASQVSKAVEDYLDTFNQLNNKNIAIGDLLITSSGTSGGANSSAEVKL